MVGAGLVVGLAVGLVLGLVHNSGPALPFAGCPCPSASRKPATFDAPDPAPAVAAAVRFVAAWGRLASGQSAGDWHARVRELATAELGTALDGTDPAGLPGAAPSGRPQVRSLAGDSAMVAVPMTNGRTVLVTVVSGPPGWLVNDVQPDEGN